MKKVYIAVDDWQYDGGSAILGVYADEESAQRRVEAERSYYRKSPIWSENRIKAISCQEYEVGKDI